MRPRTLVRLIWGGAKGRRGDEQVELAEHASDYSRSERAPTAAYTVFQFLIKRLSFSSPPPLPPLADIIIMA